MGGWVERGKEEVKGEMRGKEGVKERGVRGGIGVRLGGW